MTPQVKRARLVGASVASAIALLLAVVVAVGRVGVTDSHGQTGLLYSIASDPTAGAGLPAPQWQLLVRTDQPSVYYKSGTANTAWTLLGTSVVSGGTVTSVACGTNLVCTPSPIVGAGSVATTTTPTFTSATFSATGGGGHAVVVKNRAGDPTGIVEASGSLYFDNSGNQLWVSQGAGAWRAVAFVGGGSPMFDTVLVFSFTQAAFGNANDVNLGALGQSTYVEFSSVNQGVGLTGIANGTDGLVVCLNSTDPGHNVNVFNDSTSSAAGNRIFISGGTGTDAGQQTINFQGGFCLRYDGSSSHWRQFTVRT